MSPRLASTTTRAPAARASAIVRSSTATPRDPCRSKNADWGFKTATCEPSASTTVRANRSRPSGSSPRPQSASSAGCGSIPTHNRPRASIAACSRLPNVIGNLRGCWRVGTSAKLSNQPGRPQRAAVNETGIGLDEGGAGGQAAARLRRGIDTADGHQRDMRAGAFSHQPQNGQRAMTQRRPGQPARAGGRNLFGRRSEVAAADGRVGGDDAIEAEFDGQAGDGEDVLVGQVGG